MISETLVATLITGCVTVLVCILTAFFGYKQTKLNKKIDESNKATEERAEARKKESFLAMKMNFAVSKLTVGVALAIKNNHANGELENGLQEVEAAQKEYIDFIQKISSEHLAK